jgi:3-oxoacyl-[acyl-carrier protein] reductase
VELGIKGKSAIVTGGSKGIGYAAARRLLAEGANVTICARNTATLDKAESELAKAGSGKVHALTADMSRKGDIENLVKSAAATFGPVQILVNNAGEMATGHFDVMAEERLQLQLDTKLFGYMRAIRLVFPMMREKGWGRIVNIIGGAGKQPDPVALGSSITNAAILSLTKSLSNDWGKHGVCVNGVCPGYVDTDNWARNMAGVIQAGDFGGKDEKETRINAPKNNAMGRWGDPDELSGAIAFLCSDQASYITGVTINTDGGRLKALW